MPGQVLARVAVPANGQVDVMTGTDFEYPDPGGNAITVAAVTEGAAGSGLITLAAGTRRVIERGNLRLEATPGLNPVIPDDVVARGAAMPGERIRVLLINTTGAPVNMTALVDLA